MELAAKLARGADRALNLVLGFVLLVVFLYGSYALWDTWRIYDDAGVDAALLEYKPTLENGGSSPGLAGLMDVNPDVRAWLTVDGTNIDYPLLQGQDNAKYVNTNVYGEFSLSGSLFLDYRNAPDFSDGYSLVYGHHMDAAAMFGELAYFLQPDYFEQHKTGTLYLPDKTYQIEFFACMQTDAYDKYVFYPPLSGQEEQTALLEHIRQEATQYRETGISAADKVLALSTCSDASTNARTVVFGRLLEIETTGGGVSGT